MLKKVGAALRGREHITQILRGALQDEAFLKETAQAAQDRKKDAYHALGKHRIPLLLKDDLSIILHAWTGGGQESAVNEFQHSHHNTFSGLVLRGEVEHFVYRTKMASVETRILASEKMFPIFDLLLEQWPEDNRNDTSSTTGSHVLDLVLFAMRRIEQAHVSVPIHDSTYLPTVEKINCDSVFEKSDSNGLGAQCKAVRSLTSAPRSDDVDVSLRRRKIAVAVAAFLNSLVKSAKASRAQKTPAETTSEEIESFSFVHSFETVSNGISRERRGLGPKKFWGLSETAPVGVDRLRPGSSYILGAALVHKYVPREGTVTLVVRKGRTTRSTRLHRRFVGEKKHDMSTKQESRAREGGFVTRKFVKEQFERVLKMLEDGHDDQVRGIMPAVESLPLGETEASSPASGVAEVEQLEVDAGAACWLPATSADADIVTDDSSVVVIGAKMGTVLGGPLKLVVSAQGVSAVHDANPEDEVKVAPVAKVDNGGVFCFLSNETPGSAAISSFVVARKSLTTNADRTRAAIVKYGTKKAWDFIHSLDMRLLMTYKFFGDFLTERIVDKAMTGEDFFGGIVSDGIVGEGDRHDDFPAASSHLQNYHWNLFPLASISFRRALESRLRLKLKDNVFCTGSHEESEARTKLEMKLVKTLRDLRLGRAASTGDHFSSAVEQLQLGLRYGVRDVPFYHGVLDIDYPEFYSVGPFFGPGSHRPSNIENIHDVRPTPRLSEEEVFSGGVGYNGTPIGALRDPFHHRFVLSSAGTSGGEVEEVPRAPLLISERGPTRSFYGRLDLRCSVSPAQGFFEPTTLRTDRGSSWQRFLAATAAVNNLSGPDVASAHIMKQFLKALGADRENPTHTFLQLITCALEDEEFMRKSSEKFDANGGKMVYHALGKDRVPLFVDQDVSVIAHMWGGAGQDNPVNEFQHTHHNSFGGLILTGTVEHFVYRTRKASSETEELAAEIIGEYLAHLTTENNQHVKGDSSRKENENGMTEAVKLALFALRRLQLHHLDVPIHDSTFLPAVGAVVCEQIPDELKFFPATISAVESSCGALKEAISEKASEEDMSVRLAEFMLLVKEARPRMEETLAPRSSTREGLAAKLRAFAHVQGFESNLCNLGHNRGCGQTLHKGLVEVAKVGVDYMQVGFYDNYAGAGEGFFVSKIREEKLSHSPKSLSSASQMQDYRINATGQADVCPSSSFCVLM